MNLKNAPWRKSTYSGENGGDCIELAQVPSNLLWRKASHSASNAAECVELADAAGVVAVRDSKDPDGPVLFLTPATLRNAVKTAPMTR